MWGDSLERRQLGMKALYGLLGALDRCTRLASLLTPRAGEEAKADLIEALCKLVLAGGLGAECSLDAPPLV